MNIDTRNLVIRKSVRTDIEFLAKILTNDQVQKHMGGVVASYEDTLSLIKTRPQVLDDIFVIDLKPEKTKIGIVAFAPNNHLNAKEILISIMPEYWGHEYGPETLSVFKDFWMNSNNTNCMYVTVEPENNKSIAMLQKEGFVFLEIYKEAHGPTQHVYKYEKENT
jgi:ribosomal-protein-alanine N-acetyltransferase